MRHRAVVSWVYELPWGPNRRWLREGGVLGAIVGGWQIAGIATFTTGRPFTVFMQTGVNNGAPSWPNRIGSGKLDDPTVDLWYNPADFVAPPANTYGDTGRGILYGPGHVNFDTSLSKRFTVVGRANVEFRWDAFNLFNHPGFGFPNQNFDSPTAGPHHVDRRRQPVDAVLAQVQFLRMIQKPNSGVEFLGDPRKGSSQGCQRRRRRCVRVGSADRWGRVVEAARTGRRQRPCCAGVRQRLRQVSSEGAGYRDAPHALAVGRGHHDDDHCASRADLG